MRRLFLVAGFLILSNAVIAQRSAPRLQLPDSIVQVDPEWIDLDNDGLLDIFLLMKSKSGGNYVAIIKGDSVDLLYEMDDRDKVFPIISSQAYLITDYDRDNAMDVIVSGEKNNAPVTAIYLNKGGFEFEEKITTLPSFMLARFVDLDNDARPELIVSGVGNYSKILKQTSEFSWAVIDSLKINCTSMEVLDKDGDGDTDIFVSGMVEANSLMSGFLINEGNFYFTKEHTTPLAGNTSSGDFNGDGFFDIILMGKDLAGQGHTKKYLSGAKGYTIENMSTVLKNGNPFVADFNYDGIVDIGFHGTTISGDTVNIIQYNNGDIELLPRRQVLAQRFGDFDHTGNLNLLTVFSGDFLTVALPENLLKLKNEGPKSPTRAVALPVFNRVFMYWEKPADDHTATPSLTFDLHLTGTSNFQAGEFDLLNEKRLAVTHGNNGTNNFKLIKDISPDNLQFAIQAIDNSFHSGRPCIGGNSGSQACGGKITAEKISACSKERLVLESPPGSLWFSFANGFLGIGEDYSFSSDIGDTLFYYNPIEEGCSSLKAWSIQINDDTLKTEKNEKYACSGTSLEFGVEPGWQNITWMSQIKGPLGSSEKIIFPVSEPDSISVTLSNTKGCKIIRKTAIKISKPDLKLAADQYKIMKGGQVPLEASGADRYSWSPPTGLNDPNIRNPISSPSSSLQYIVTGYDSLNCASQATVTISVEQTGFVPNLFSPNDDGQNDQLRIYGVSSAQRFTFSIYDREGALVYKTSDVAEALQQGWDGTKNGTAQPPGVYFWKVKGEIPSGQLLLNGKDSGSIVLIR
ncbi:MAG TPA: FG-GAP-like repeat-containing protein [Chryseolinea sp.]|nr:FG-GAP-like repeat-containing protein [Chryseolinea sp.]